MTPYECVVISKAFTIQYWRGFNLNFHRQYKNEVYIPKIAVGELFLHRGSTRDDEVLPMSVSLLIANYLAKLTSTKVPVEYLTLIVSILFLL